ncbi:MAG: pyridoxal-phosphate dependent enzyme [Bacteroidota bacterium]
MDLFNINIPSPIEKVDHSFLVENEINLFVKREDLIHPHVSGNKWRKLKYNLIEAKKMGRDTIITFGGAFSNHIHATAAACRTLNLKSVGIIRGEYDEQNPTLQFAQSCGMQLKFIDRQSYREKENSDAVRSIIADYINYYLVPEGGSNPKAYKGLQELADEINKLNVDVVMVSSGTGGTATGILKHLNPGMELWVFSSLKSDYLRDEILSKTDSSKHKRLKFRANYHLGGYGKTPKRLIDFINRFLKESKILVDPIYNGKLLFGFYDMVHNGLIDSSKSYLWIHTGGLQGINAYNYMAEKKGKTKIRIS